MQKTSPLFCSILISFFILFAAVSHADELEELHIKVTDLYKQGHYKDAIPLAEQALQIAEKALDPQNTKLATALCDLADLDRVMCNYAAAEHLYKQSLEIREKILGKNHPEVAMSLYGLAELYRIIGNYAAAEPLHKQSLAIREKILRKNDADIAMSINGLAMLYFVTGNYAAAEPLFKRSIEIRKKVTGKDHPEVAMGIYGLGLVYYATGNYTEAGPRFKQSLKIREKALGKDHPDVAMSLLGLAMLYQAIGNYVEVASLYKRSLEIFEKTFGKDNPTVATTLNNFAEFYRATGHYDEAEPRYKRALEIYENSLGKDHPNVATSLNNLALLYVAMGNYAAAEPLYKKSLEIYEKALGKDHPNVAMTLNNLAQLYYVRGKYAEAEPIYKRSLEIFEKALGKDHPNVAMSLNNLAELYRAMGNYAAAEPLYKKSLEIYEKALGKDHTNVATSINNLAELYRSMGNYAEAEHLYKRSFEIYENTFGPDHPDVARSLSNLGVLYQTTGRYAEAEPLFKRSLQIREKALGKDHPDVAMSFNNLAMLYHSSDNYAAAEPFYKRSLEVNENALGKDHPDVATSLSNLAMLYQNTGNYAAAEPLLKRALEIREKALGKDHPDVANSLNNLAMFYHDTGNYAAAEPLYKRSVEIFTKAFGKNHTDVETSINNLAFLWLISGKMEQAFEVFKQQNDAGGLGKYYLLKGHYSEAHKQFGELFEKASSPEALIADSIGLGFACEGEGNYAEAQKWFRDAISLIEQQRTALNSAMREHFLEGNTLADFKRLDAYEGMMRVLLKENGPNAQIQALRYAEMIKSRIFFEMLVSHGLKSTKPEDEKVLEREREYQHKIGLLQKRMEIIRKPGVILPPGEAEQVKVELEKSLTEYETFLKEVRLKNVEVASIICALPADPAAMQATLDDDVTVLEYYTAQDRTYAWVITKNSVQIHEIKKDGLDLNAKEIQVDIGNWLAINISETPRRATPLFSSPADELSLQKLTPELKKKYREAFNKKAHELYVLMFAPVEADIKTKKLVIVPHDVLHKVPFTCLTDGNKALLDKYNLSIAPASSLIEFIVKKRKADTGKFLAFANPATDKKKLPFAESEVQAIESLFPNKDVFNGADATKTRATALSGDFNVIHFACHGEFNDMQPLQSGLLLAKWGEDDGVLRVPDVFGLNLQKANLVTLSACETALSKVRGGEDWAGMSRGFIYAGTPTILATLWSVDDKSTAILMKNFYTNWLQKGMTKPAALRQAQLDIKAMPEYSHPYYWAPFVMIGDWR